jgi:hypothetical protein
LNPVAVLAPVAGATTMLGGGLTVTRSTTFGDSTLSEDGLKYRYAANAAIRTIAVFTLGKYLCCCLGYCLNVPWIRVIRCW